MSSPTNIDYISSTPVAKLRDCSRVLNHLGLINRKLRIGRRWGLVSTAKGEPASATNLLMGLHTGESSLQSVLNEISSRHGAGIDSLCSDLVRCYPTGLLEFHPTDACDLNCVDCHYRNKANSVVPFSRINGVLRQLSPMAITITGGGEPNAYRSERRNFADLVTEIKEAVPQASLGLINNNSHIPSGDWTSALAWQRTSIDAATAETFMTIKRRPLFETVTENVKRLLNETSIANVGVGFLFRRENAHEVALFLNQWYEWCIGQSSEIQHRFNIQFRPISPGIEDIRGLIDSGASYPNDATHEALRDQVLQVRRMVDLSPGFAAFISGNTNFDAYLGKHASFDSSLFIHKEKHFDQCYNCLCHRVLRATGEEYPDFLLCNHPDLALGNVLYGNPGEEMLRVALMEFYYFNRLGPFCNPVECRQGWVSNVVEENFECHEPPAAKLCPTDFFF